jgi:tetratricopeptide (TPR) repeat protein
VLFFKQAAAMSALEVEARIRAGVALEGVGRHEAALEWLDGVPAHDDAPLGYVQHLARGHAFDALNRPREAAAAYQRALEYAPTAQLAAIGQAAALLRAGDVEAAAAVADRTRLVPKVSVAGDPRLIFRRADARFLLEWIAEIRRLRR